MFCGLPIQKSRIKNQKSKIRGAVATELALLVAAVYVPLIIGGIYLGWLALARERVQQAHHYALYAEGDQTEAFGDQGEVTQHFFREFTGDLQLDETEADPPDIPEDGLIRDLFEAYTEPIYYHNVSAHGSFHLVNGRVVYQEHVQESEGYSVRPEGEIVNAFRLLEDNIPENITDHLQEYLRRRKVQGVYLHSWRFDESAALSRGGDDIIRKEPPPVRPFNLRVPHGPGAAPDQWEPEAAIRWEKTRMIGDQDPPAASQRARVGCPPFFPPGDNARDFWHPCEGPPN